MVQQSGTINSEGYSNETYIVTGSPLTYTIRGMKFDETYAIHVRAVSLSGELGTADEEILVQVKTSISTLMITDSTGNPVQSASATSTISSLVTILPSASAFAQAVSISNIS